MAGVRFDLPTPDIETQPFWDAARDGRLLIKRCAACGRAHFYPRPFCPFCWSERVEWEEASGRATLYTWSVVHQNDLPPFGERVPYVAAIVDLDCQLLNQDGEVKVSGEATAALPSRG